METRAEINKKKFTFNGNSLFVFIFIVSYVIIDEIVFSFGLGLNFTPYKFLFALSFGLLLFFLSVLPKNAKMGVAVGSIGIILIDTVYISQYVYWLIFSTPYFLNSIAGTGAAMEFFSVVVNNFFKNWGISSVFIVHLAMFFTIYRIAFKQWEKPPKLKRNAGIAFLASILLAVGLPLLTTGLNSPAYLMLYEHIPTSSANVFGMLPSMALDAKFNLFKISLQYDNANAHVENITIEKKETPPKTTASPTPMPTPPPKEEEVVHAPNVMDIAFNKEEPNETLAEMNAYFEGKTPTMQNEYTGMFNGKNLILITAEGFSGGVIDKNLTPTLYKLSTEGFVFNNFYTPIWGVSTSDGEYVATTGLIPKTGVWSYTKIANNYMPFAFGNQFAKEGISPLAFHNHSYTYYNRDKSYPAMGYTYYAKNHGLEVTDIWPESDVEMMELSTPMYINEDNFHVYYLTVSGHLEYNFGGNNMAQKNKANVEGLNASTAVKAYTACQLELEYALQNLIASLESAGKLEDTVIALSADHYPYGLTNEEYAELRNKDSLETTFELYENEFILWSPIITKPIVVDKYASSLDIAPTLSNLFGLSYDSRLFMGRDILAKGEGLVVFQDRSFITDRVKFDANKNKAEVIGEGEVSEEYIEDKASEVASMFKYSADIIDTDYYGYLFGVKKE